MDMLQLREKEIFDTLTKIKKFNFVVIGGYAVNAYALPRFSVDCDIVVLDIKEAERICDELETLGYKKEITESLDMPYKGDFFRYEKTVDIGFKVSIDILAKDIFDRQTHSSFSAKWVFENASIQSFKGKTITEKLSLRVINIDALIVMKIISCRNTDIRDVFMMAVNAKDLEWIKEEVSKRYKFLERLSKIKEKITSPKFKDDLQGVYGYIDNIIFEKHKKKILEMYNQ